MFNNNCHFSNPFNYQSNSNESIFTGKFVMPNFSKCWFFKYYNIFEELED